MAERQTARAELNLPLVVTSLLKGAVYRDAHERTWAQLVRLEPQVRDHVAVLGLDVVIDEDEGYAYLHSKPEDLESDVAIPRLVARRPLSFHLSLLLALLRKKIAEFDADNAEPRLIISRDVVVDMMRLFLATSTKETRLVDQVDTLIGKVVDLGFLRPIKDTPGAYEVRRILKAFVDAQWLGEFDERLREYEQLAADKGES